MLFMNHIMCCFWYFLSNIDEFFFNFFFYYLDFHFCSFGPDTWVARNGLVDEDYVTKYITSYYW